MVKDEYVGELKDEVEEIVMMDEKKEEDFNGSFSKGCGIWLTIICC